MNDILQKKKKKLAVVSPCLIKQKTAKRINNASSIPSPAPHSCWDLLSEGVHVYSADEWESNYLIWHQSADFTEAWPSVSLFLRTHGWPFAGGMALRYVCKCVSRPVLWSHGDKGRLPQQRDSAAPHLRTRGRTQNWKGDWTLDLFVCLVGAAQQTLDQCCSPVLADFLLFFLTLTLTHLSQLPQLYRLPPLKNDQNECLSCVGLSWKTLKVRDKLVDF